MWSRVGHVFALIHSVAFCANRRGKRFVFAHVFDMRHRVNCVVIIVVVCHKRVAKRFFVATPQKNCNEEFICDHVARGSVASKATPPCAPILPNHHVPHTCRTLRTHFKAQRRGGEFINALPHIIPGQVESSAADPNSADQHSGAHVSTEPGRPSQQRGGRALEKKREGGA